MSAVRRSSSHELRNRLVLTLCLGAIALGFIVLIGYALGSASIATLGTGGKPAAAISALVFILLGAGILAVGRPLLHGVLVTPRRVALLVMVIATASLLSAALSRDSGEWQLIASHGGVYFHAFPVTALLILALGSALALTTTRWDLAGHLIASAVLLLCIFFFLGYVLHIPSFFNRLGRLAPVAVTTSGLALLSAAAVLVRPRGWVVPLLSRTSAGAMSRLLLPAIFIVSFFSVALNNRLTADGHDPRVGLTAMVAVNIFFGAAILLGVGAALHKRESDRARLAAIVSSSTEAITSISNTGIIESWNGGAERIYGYTQMEAIGRSIRMLAPPEREDEISLLIERARHGERVESLETVRVAKDGRRVQVSLNVSPVLDDDGNLSGASVVTHDITDRKKAEQARVEVEARYRTLVESLPQKIMLKDRHSVYVLVNDAYARDLGVDPEAVAGRTDFDFFPADLAEKYRADDARIMDAGVAEVLEEEYVEAGQRRSVHTVKTPLKDAQGNVTGILVILWDITEKKAAEERLTKAVAELERFNRDLEKSEAALKEAQRVAKIGHWETSLVTGVMTWSDEHYRILGIPVGSVAPSYALLLSMMDPHERRREEDAFARSLASDGGVIETAVDLHITTPAGVALVVAQRVFLDRDAAGKIVGFHGTLQDITERAATQHALRDSEAALAEAQQIAHIGSWVLDAESGAMQVSEEAFRIFAVDPRPVAPIQIFLDRVHEDDRASLKSAIAAALETGTLDVEVRIVTPDGTRVAHIVARRRGADEGRPGLIGTTQDITERMSAEEALRERTESLERSNAELERFNRLAVGRELRMIELKRQINDLCMQSGQTARHVLPEEHALVEETS